MKSFLSVCVHNIYRALNTCIVGAGPAGLSVAKYLLKVTVDLKNVFSSSQFVGWYNAHPDFKQVTTSKERVAFSLLSKKRPSYENILKSPPSIGFYIQQGPRGDSIWTTKTRLAEQCFLFKN
ncbi:hypothetical protein RF11_04512 [Thelohanellus kitauei]|uniref:Uncharacterized protein n=1 Tax=Thelohanellus kitauei TaxID=669202 RepID=A0A0C2IQC2_THEKT|nr:hypothetical protein RF11_04512 [Thelohanellus kitauei]